MSVLSSPHTFNSASKDPQTVTISIGELAEVVRRANGMPAPPPPSPPSGLGNPGPLGLGGFALTTFTLSAFNAGVIIDPTLQATVLPLALFYGGLAQFIAGLFEFGVNNTFGATAFCSYGAFWLSYAAFAQYVAPTLNPEKAHEAVGLFLFVWWIFTNYMLIASMKVSKIVTLVFATLSPTFFLLTVGALHPNTVCNQMGGWFGLVCALFAWYGSAAVVINSAWGRTVLPVGVYDKNKGFIESWCDFSRN